MKRSGIFVLLPVVVINHGDDMKRLRNKKVCGKCQHLRDFPNIHCRLGELMAFDRNGKMVIPKPKEPDSCRKARQFQID